MEDERGATQFASAYPGGTPMNIGGTVEPASNDLLPGSKPLPELGPTSSFSGAVVGSFSGHWRIDGYFYIPSTITGQVFFLRATGDGTVKTWLLDTDAGSGIFGVTGLDATGNVIVSLATLGTDLFDRWVNIQLAAEQNGADVGWSLTFFPVQYPAHPGGQISNTFTGSVGGITGVAWPAGEHAEGVATGHWSVLDEGGVNFPSNAAMGWVGDTAAERMIRLCNEQGIQLRLVGDPGLTAKMGVQRIATLLELLDDAENADGGILYEQPDAVGLIYRTRASMYNQPANMTLDALQEQLQNPFRPVRDDQRIRNVVTVERVDGSSLTVEDAASVADVGIYDTSISLNLFSDTQLSDAAGWLLHQGTFPGMRYPQLTTNLGVAPEVINEWLTVDQGARIHVQNLPPQHANETVKVIAEGYSEPISPTTWEPVMNCSPAAVWDVAVLFGDWVADEYLLRLDTDGSILTEPIDTTDTTLFVTVTDGPYWTSDNAECPMDIVINGERMTVTDIDAPVGDREFAGAGSADDTTSTTSFVAPSVNAPASGDLLICMWCNFNAIDTYTLPGSMTIAALTDGTYTSCEDATEVLGSSGATGTRTATFGTSDLWSALSVVVHGASGTPSVDEFLSDVDTGVGGTAQPVTLTTILPVAEGDWLLALHAWDWDPGNNMSAPSGTGWIAIADSILANASVSRVRAWAKQITAVEAGIQTVTFGVVGGINDNHARLYAISGATGITQEFTVTRSVNGVVKSHAAGSDVRLWYQPALAR